MKKDYMQITQSMMCGYIIAVAKALEAAEHKVSVEPFIPEAVNAEIVMPNVFTEERGWSGLALRWDPEDGWEAAYFDPESGRYALHSTLRLGAVPTPDVLVCSVAMIIKEGNPRAGRIVPGTPELLAAYGRHRGAVPERIWSV